MSRTDFDYFASVMFRDDVEVDFGSIGRTVDGELAIFVGTYRSGAPWSQYVFVWESGWKFRDHTWKLRPRNEDGAALLEKVLFRFIAFFISAK